MPVIMGDLKCMSDSLHSIVALRIIVMTISEIVSQQTSLHIPTYTRD